MGKLTDAVKKLIDSLQITSASPGHINEVVQVDQSIDLDAALEDSLIATDTKQEGEIETTIEKVKGFDAGNVGDVQRFTTQQIGNLKSFVQNPAGFIIQTFVKKFAKGVGIIALAIIIFEAVKWVVSELLKPGRFLDLRFKRDITKEIIAFRSREEQQKLRQGFSNIIITSSPGLRGGQGQISNTLDLVRRGQFPEQIGANTMLIASSGVSVSKAKGSTRGSQRFNR